MRNQGLWKVTRTSAESCGRCLLAAFFTSGYLRAAMEEPGQKAELRGAYKYASLGMQFAVGTLFFAGIGFALDRWLGITPALTVTGLLVGGGMSFFSVYRRVMKDTADAKQARRDKGTA